MWPNPHFPADLVTFTEEILNGKLQFLYDGHSGTYIFRNVKSKAFYASKGRNIFYFIESWVTDGF